jgi:RimJ/RimL family protein N-acetyltransferase
MLGVPQADLLTARLVLRPLRAADAAAFWPILSDPALYTWIDRDPPITRAALDARFARIAQRTAPGRTDQWLNWTVWSLGDEALGIVEATVPVTNNVHVAYMFAPAHWGKGYATEAVGAVLEAMASAGAASFEAIIDARNLASVALARRVGFTLAAVDPAHSQTWRRGA